jgi:hypothetical protein
VDRLNRLRANRRAEREQNLPALELLKRTPGMTPVEYVGGHGFPLANGGQYRLGIATDHIAVVDQRGIEVVRVAATAVLDVFAFGRGEVSAGAIGGGIGLDGMALGVGLAALINSLSRRLDSFLKLVVRDAEGVFAFPALSPMEVDAALARIRVTQRQSTSTATNQVSEGSVPPNLVAQLAHLAQMRADGVLTEAEFLSAKSKVLRSADR